MPKFKMKKEPIYHEPPKTIEFSQEIFDGDTFHSATNHLLEQINQYRFSYTDEERTLIIEQIKEQIKNNNLKFYVQDERDFYSNDLVGQTTYMCVETPQLQSVIDREEEEYRIKLSNYNAWVEKNKDKIEAYNKEKEETEKAKKEKAKEKIQKEKESAIKEALKLLKKNKIDVKKALEE